MGRCCTWGEPRRKPQRAERNVNRNVQPELLDELPVDDPMAVRSRRDLQRLNRIMGNSGLLAGALRVGLRGPPEQIMEIGAGDGTLLLDVCRRSAGALPPGTTHKRTAFVLDRLDATSAATRSEFDRLGWQTEVMIRDVFHWLREPAEFKLDAVIANLFLHHLSDEQLSKLFALASVRTGVFAAVEPRRCVRALLFSKMVGVIGCNGVTRHDAPVSVRAGFTGSELSRLWPQGDGWTVQEGPAGLFGHLFMARQKP
jgi:hypothetical protein